MSDAVFEAWCSTWLWAYGFKEGDYPVPDWALRILYDIELKLLEDAEG